MQKLLLATILWLSTLNTSHTPGAPNLTLLPAPQHLTPAEGRFLLTPAFNISIQAATTDTILYAAANRMYQTLNRRTALFFNTQDVKPQTPKDSCQMHISVHKPTIRQTGIDESYILIITNNKVTLDAPTTTGALHGL